MFAIIYAIIKGIVISVILWIGCVLLGRFSNKRFSPTIVHHLVMFAVAAITCILIISYSITSSLKSTVEEYGSLAINLKNLPVNLNLPDINTSGINSEDYIASVTEEIENEYPIIANRISKLTDGNEELQAQVSQILSSNVRDKTTQIINAITTTCYQGIVDKLFWLKFKFLVGIIIVQLIQVVMVLMAANQQMRKAMFVTNYDFTE